MTCRQREFSKNERGAEMTIDIDLDILDSVSTRARSLASQVRSSAGKVDNAANGIEASWRSNSSASYVYEVEETARRLRMVADELESLSGAISRYSSNMRRIEKELASKVGGGAGGGGGGSW